MLRSRTLRIVCKFSADAALFEATKQFFTKTAAQNQRLVHLLKPTVLIFRLRVFAQTVVSFFVVDVVVLEGDCTFKELDIDIFSCCYNCEGISGLLKRSSPKPNIDPAKWDKVVSCFRT